MNYRRFGRLCLLFVTSICTVAADDWIAREKIRAAWIYHSDGVDKLAVFKRHGLNALVTSAREPERFAEWAKEAKRAGIHLFGVLGFSFDAAQAGMRRAVFGNGHESVVACPTDERFWQERMIAPAVQLAREGMTAEKEISGILIDFELYANEKAGAIYYTDACYCDHCFGDFLKHEQLDETAVQVPFAERVKWLKEKKLFDGYHPFLQQQVRALAVRMRQAVEAVRKDFFVGFYPIPHNWMLVGVAQGLGTPEHPMILWATETYGGGGPKKIADDWREQMRQKEIHAYYCGGMLLRFYSAANLAANMFEITRKASGYWLFTVHTLCIAESDQKGDYYLAAGTPADYLREIKRGNGALDRLASQANHQPDFGFVEEPIRYRHVGNDISRFKPPTLRDRSTVERGQETPLAPLSLTGGNHLMMILQAGEVPVFRFRADKAKSGDIWGVSYAVVDASKSILTQGRMPPGEETAVKFKTAGTGLHTLVVTAGYYGRCTLLSSTVPFALWTGNNFEVSGPGGTLHFFVREDLKAFTLSAQCQWGTSGVKMTLFDPDGGIAKAQETDPYVRNLSWTIPTGGKTGRVWSLRVEPLPKKSFRTVVIRFDPKLLAAATLSPQHLFTEIRP